MNHKYWYLFIIFKRKDSGASGYASIKEISGEYSRRKQVSNSNIDSTVKTLFILELTNLKMFLTRECLRFRLYITTLFFVAKLQQK